MVRDWDRVKGTIHFLYVIKGEKLEVVKECMISNHHFEASLRAYKMKIKEWRWRTHKKGCENKEIVRRRRRRPNAAEEYDNHVDGEAGAPIAAKEHENDSDGDASAPIAVEEYEKHVDGDADAVALPARVTVSNFRTCPPLLSPDLPSIFPAEIGNMWSPGPTIDCQARPYTFHRSLGAASENFPITSELSVPNQRDWFGKTQLHRAVESGNILEVDRLLSQGPRLDIVDLEGNQPLHLATISKHPDIIRVLLRSGVDVNARGANGETPVHLAIHSPEGLEGLLEARPDLSAFNNDGYTALQKALWTFINKQISDGGVVTTLLGHGARPNIPGTRGTAFHMVLEQMLPFEKFSYLHILLESSADVLSKMRDGALPFQVFLDKIWLHQGSANLWWSEMKAFLDRGANPNTMVDQGEMLLYKVLYLPSYTPFWGFDGVLATLCATADIHTPSDAGDFPLHITMDKPKWSIDVCVGVISHLIRRGTNLNKLNGKGKGPLQILSAGNSVSIARVERILKSLVEGDVDAMLVDSSGQLAIEALYRKCKFHDRTDILKILVDAYKKNRRSSEDLLVDVPRVGWWRRYWNFRCGSSWSPEASELLSDASDLPEGLPNVLLTFAAEDALQKAKEDLAIEKRGVRVDHASSELRIWENTVTILQDCREMNLRIRKSGCQNLREMLD